MIPVIVSLFAATSAHAQSVVKDPLMSHVKIQCEDAVTNGKVGEFVYQVIRESLAKFREVNPRVEEAVRTRLSKRDLVVICDPEALKQMGAEADARGSLFGPYRIRVGLSSANLVGTNAQKNTILHEMLHYAKIDNVSGRIHSTVLELGAMSEDNVYACADVVYPQVFVSDPVSALDAEETCANALSDEQEE